MVRSGQQILSFVAQGYDFFIFADLNIMFEIMFNEITTHEKSFNNWVIIYFLSFLFHNQRNNKISFKIIYKILHTTYIYLPIKGSC